MLTAVDLLMSPGYGMVPTTLSWSGLWGLCRSRMMCASASRRIWTLVSDLEWTAAYTQRQYRLLQSRVSIVDQVTGLYQTTGPCRMLTARRYHYGFGVITGEEFFTDANSLTMVRRVRGVHAAFAAAPLSDQHTANPIGGNYFPITSAMYLRDARSGRQLTLVTDRGQGAPPGTWQPAMPCTAVRAAAEQVVCALA
jgi:hypothetical protein